MVVAWGSHPALLWTHSAPRQDGLPEPLFPVGQQDIPAPLALQCSSQERTLSPGLLLFSSQDSYSFCESAWLLCLWAEPVPEAPASLVLLSPGDCSCIPSIAKGPYHPTPFPRVTGGGGARDRRSVEGEIASMGRSQAIHQEHPQVCPEPLSDSPSSRESSLPEPEVPAGRKAC